MAKETLFAWVEELERECCALLLPIVLQTDVNDKWIWELRASSKYNVTSAYNLLTSRDQPLNNDQNTIIWHKKVPLKVNIFVGRLLCNRLPTTENLIKGVSFHQIHCFTQAVTSIKRILIFHFYILQCLYQLLCSRKLYIWLLYHILNFVSNDKL